jgi:hypothetical protein
MVAKFQGHEKQVVAYRTLTKSDFVNKETVTIFVELRKAEGGLELSITGVGKPMNARDGGEWGGAAHERLTEAFPEIAPFVGYHLNGMRAGCEHQRALGWKPCPGHYGPDAAPCEGARPLNEAQRIKLFSGRAHFASSTSWRCSMDKVGKPCPVCGYCYGTKWLHETLPDEVVAWVKSFGNDKLFEKYGERE